MTGGSCEESLAAGSQVVGKENDCIADDRQRMANGEKRGEVTVCCKVTINLANSTDVYR